VHVYKNIISHKGQKEFKTYFGRKTKVLEKEAKRKNKTKRRREKAMEWKSEIGKGEEE